MEQTLNKIIKYALYSLVFFLPLWFLPWTVSPLAQNKQTLLAGFCFLIVICWAIKVFTSGKLSFVWNKLTLAVFLLLLVLGASTLFSGSGSQSFWGMNFEADAFFNFILYALTFFIFANLLKEEKEISKTILAFLLGSGVLAALFLANSFFNIFPWDFAQGAGFNSVGSAQALSLFLAGAFLVLMALVSANQLKSVSICKMPEKLVRAKLIFLGILLLAAVFFINYWLAWLGIIFGTAIIIWSRLREIGAPLNSAKGAALQPADGFKKLIPLLIIFTVALIFLFIKFPLENILNLPAEVSPTYKATFDISQKTLMDGPKNFVFGSGPATFGFDYSLHRSIGPNFTSFWNVRFTQGVAALPTFLATFGILGILAVLFLLVVFFWQGFTRLSFSSKNFGGLAAFVGGFYFLILLFFYPLNFTLIFSAFLMMGLWQAVTYSGNVKEFSLSQSPQKSFFVMIILCLLIVGSIIGFYTLYQKYAGALNYEKGVTTENLDEAITSLNRAVNLDGGKDVYFRVLSQVFLLKTNEILNNQEMSQEEQKNIFQQVVSAAEASATNAVQINPKDSLNWQQLGSVYENLVPFNVKNADQMAIQNYQKAAELDPQNPQFPFFLGRTYFAMSNLDEAKKQLEKSLELKTDFTSATDLLKQIEEAPK